MKASADRQLVISGFGGQGILFITRLLADAAIAMGLPVLTSETHGMAQRGGIVVSHLKVGAFASPLVRPGRADGLLALKAETVPLFRHFLKPDGWVVSNGTGGGADGEPITVDADRLSMALGDTRAVNLVCLGRALAEPGLLFCGPEQVEATLREKLAGKPKMLDGALAALRAGRSAPC